MYEDYKVVYHNDFEIVDLAGGGNQRPKIKGETKYCRILIKPIFKLEELTGEVIDEEKKVIHRCHPYMTQIIADAIVEQRIEDMKEKNYTFNKEEIENLRIICLCLYHQKQNKMAEEIEEQYLCKTSLSPMSYTEIINKYFSIITEDTLTVIRKRITPIYKLRNENIPTILKLYL